MKAAAKRAAEEAEENPAPQFRAIAPIAVVGLALNEIGRKPKTKWVKPEELQVDERYQRSLGPRSISLIRKIATQWDWKAFKPPVVVEGADGRMRVVDGQHTAIGAATRNAMDGAVGLILVVVVDAATMEEQATAFVRHNLDRNAMTPGQIHHAKVAAGDEDSLTVEQCCARANARVLRHLGPGDYSAGGTLAIGTLHMILGRRHAMGLRRVLEICVEAQFAPIQAHHLYGVEEALFDPENAGIDPARFGLALRARRDEIEKEASLLAAAQGVTRRRAFAAILSRHARKRIRAQGEPG